MSQSIGAKPRAGRVVLDAVIGVVIGLLHPILLVLQLMSPMSAPCVAGMVGGALYAHAGAIPLIALGVSMLLSSVLSMGLLPTLVSLPLCVASMCVVVWGVRGKKPFFRQMRLSVGAGIAGAMLSIVMVLAFFGQNLVSQMIEQVHATFDEMMPLLWDAQRATLESAGLNITYEEYADLFLDMLKVLQHYYENALPGNVLTGAALTAVLSTLWANWLSARRGEATSESFVGLSEWFLPANPTWGILLMLATAAILQGMGINGSAMAWLCVRGLARLAFVVQAMAAMDRRQRAHGATRGRRVGMVVLVVVLGVMSNFGGIDVFTLLAAIGCASALFGRKGALRPWIDRHKDKMSGDDR